MPHPERPADGPAMRVHVMWIWPSHDPYVAPDAPLTLDEDLAVLRLLRDLRGYT